MTIIRILLALSLAAPAACSSSKSDPAATGGAEKGEAAGVSDSDMTAAMSSLMAPYETCRSLLAGDKTEGVGDCAAAINKAASDGARVAPSNARAPWLATAAAADKLAGAASDLGGARLAFGDVSKQVIELLTSAPTVASKYHVFECPMAKGFNRWAQSDTTLANPYMGSAMLSCGSEVHDHHAGGMMHGGSMPHAGQ